MTNLTTHAAWVLTVTFVISLAYEIHRVTARRGASRHDTPRSFARVIVLYVVAAIVIIGLFAGGEFAAWAGLVFSVVSILISAFYYNPIVMLERHHGRPGVIDWLEDLVYTGLLFAAAAILIYAVAGAGPPA